MNQKQVEVLTNQNVGVNRKKLEHSNSDKLLNHIKTAFSSHINDMAANISSNIYSM